MPSFQDGRCKTLDASADGYARGEACVTHLLEHFEGDDIQAANLENSCIIICGTAVNQDGRSSSLTVSSQHPFLVASVWQNFPTQYYKTANKTSLIP